MGDSFVSQELNSLCNIVNNLEHFLLQESQLYFLSIDYFILQCEADKLKPCLDFVEIPTVRLLFLLDNFLALNQIWTTTKSNFSSHGFLKYYIKLPFLWSHPFYRHKMFNCVPSIES